MACFFAISIGAETVVYDGNEIELVNNLGDPSWYTGTVASTIQDKDSVVILKDSEGNLTASPSYYLFRYIIDGSGVRIAWASDKGVDYSFVNEKDGKNYTSGSMYYVELPYGITTCTAYNVWGKGKAEPNVVEFVLPDSVTTISYNAFAEINNCKKITMSKNVKVIDEWSFYNSKDLVSVVFPEDCALEKIAKGSFSGCSKLSYVNLENCQSLKTLGDSAFGSCTAIDELYLPDSLERIGFQALYNLGEIKLNSDYLPTSLTFIDQYFLSDCKVENEVLYFPEGFTSFNSRYCFIGSFAPKTSLTLVFLGKMTSVNMYDVNLSNIVNNGTKQPIRLVFAQNEFSELSGAIVPLTKLNGKNGFITKYADGSPVYVTNEGTLTVTFNDMSLWNGTNLGTDADGNTVYLADSPVEMVFCGGDTVEINYSVRLNHTDKGWYRFHTSSEAYDMENHTVHYDKIVVESLVSCGSDGFTTNTCVVCDRAASVTVPATGDHKYTDDSDCTTAHICTVCAKVVVEALEHAEVTTIVYTSYDASGVKTVCCSNAGCGYKVITDVAAMLECLGYSAQEFGKGGIAVGYRVNSEAISEYEAIGNKAVKLGVFAVTQEKLGSSDVFGENGVAVSGAITVELLNREISAFELKIVGFAEEQKDVELAMGAYVCVTEGDNTEYSYIQSGTPEESEKYAFVTYNSVVG